jgi:glutamate N-acetyltransferase/amino-acid N-acetyltransferase
MSVTAAKGFRASGVWSAVKGSGKPDLALVVSDLPATAAGVFSPNRFRASQVDAAIGKLGATRGKARAILAVSGCANALVGPRGFRDQAALSRTASRLLGVPENQVLFSATGPIGMPLPVDRIRRGMVKAVRELSSSQAAGLMAARAIMTTDTRPKQVTAGFTDGGTRYAVGGMAKGVGMVSPHMATILVFITTDAAVPAPALGKALRSAVRPSFNSITVDGQASTNDTAVVLANGAASGAPLSARGRSGFGRALSEVCLSLALELVRDGEGAKHLVDIAVTGAASPADAERVARAIADSPLVKTMFFGRQTNWGRIAQAIGASGARLAADRVRIKVGGQLVVRGNSTVPTRYTILTRLAEPEIRVEVDLGQGRGRARVYTCDLTDGYVRINAGYLS